ncbi:aminoglycoside phosphotransferase family protein [Glycomyces niveus]|uniref:Aminoglycoside phosphotransferase family protein n=1 Tax=Glycomyces niveus TaxID=2820287 RepID=A0ABS3TZ57_9ACTN|nr:aminoglycoside phosphotransferase family protein [Glycomyces sp. NEAU-S30]MBO3731781.1 aminoglycoside phosphotransferase family protein [Glycomyces sp. NEAU-S30]
MRDTAIDERLLRDLLEQQCPDLADLEVKSVDGGWTNQMWRLGPDLAVRIPRRDDAPALLEREHRLIPDIASRLPLPVPVPTRLSEPSERFPYHWLITTWVHGTPADLAPITDPESAATLADFLTALHLEGPADNPANDGRGAPLTDMDERFEQTLQRLPEVDADRARAVWRESLDAAPHNGTGVWLHGDLHPANVVVEDGRLSGVIDFGEIFVGDPAVDLAAAWILLPDGASDAFFNAYKAADEATILRARGLALIKAFGLIEIGIAGERGWAGGKPTWKPAGEAALSRILR